MKTLMFIFTFIVVLALYCAGFFVPETQGIEVTFDGHVVLNDTEMAQLVGGSSSRLTNEPDQIYTASGSLPDCAAATPPNCADVTPTNVFYQKYICVSCFKRNDDYQYTSVSGVPRHKLWKCVRKGNKCSAKGQTMGTFTSCNINLKKTCSQYL